MHGLRLFSDVSARGNAAPSLLHGYASHTETDHAASRLLPLILHPDEKSGTTHNCSKIHEGNADNNSYFHDADIVHTKHNRMLRNILNTFIKFFIPLLFPQQELFFMLSYINFFQTSNHSIP